MLRSLVGSEMCIRDRGYVDKKRKQHPPPGDDASTAVAAPGRVGRDEQVAARHTTPNGGPHLELERLRLKTWPKPEFSIAETTWPTYIYIYLYPAAGADASALALHPTIRAANNAVPLHQRRSRQYRWEPMLPTVHTRSQRSLLRGAPNQ